MNTSAASNVIQLPTRHRDDPLDPPDPCGGGALVAVLAEWRIVCTGRDTFVLSGPSYRFPHAWVAAHLPAGGGWYFTTAPDHNGRWHAIIDR